MNAKINGCDDGGEFLQPNDLTICTQNLQTMVDNYWKNILKYY